MRPNPERPRQAATNTLLDGNGRDLVWQTRRGSVGALWREIFLATAGLVARFRSVPTSNPLALEDYCDPEWAEWYRMSPAERWAESGRLWAAYLALGGSLDPEPDTQSPFFDPSAPGPGAPDGRPGLRIVRRGGV